MAKPDAPSPKRKKSTLRASISKTSLKSLVDTVLDTIVDGVITIDAHGHIQSYNKACEGIFGYRAKEVVGKNIHVLMPEPYRTEHDGYLHNYKQTGTAKIIGIGREVMGQRKDGSVFPMELAVGETSQGGEHAFVGIIRNISAHKLAQQQILDSAQEMQAVLNTVVDGIITIDTRAVIRSFNPSAERIFGYRADEVIGKNVNILMPEPYHSEHDGYVHNYNTTGNAKIIGIGREVTAKRKDGSIFPMELGVSSFELSGKKMFVGIIRDISERQEGEKAREQLRQAQKMEALGQLTGGIAHDFNNLLAIVLGNLDFMVERTEETSPLRQFLRPSIEAAEHGAELTRQLLAFGRKQALQPQIISINDLLYYLTVMVRHTLGERIALVLNTHEDLWNVNVDPTQLQNALLNLAVNARDAMPEGGKLIFETSNVTLDGDYTAHNQEALTGDYAMIAVSDTGEGMSPEIMGKAFEPFFTTKEVGKGSGLGLSMVYGFVKQSRGHIKLYSEPGHGTTIRIYLPRVEGAVTSIEQKETKPLSMGKKTTCILVVEDNIEVLKLTSSMVESLGYKLLTAQNGEIAMELLKTHSDIDLLLTDVMLPGALNGPQLAKEAVVLHPGLKVIFNSGYAEHAILQKGILDKGVHLISKPFRKQQLANKLVEVLKTKKPQ